MQVTITSRHAEISEQTRDYGRKKIEHFSQIVSEITEVHLVIEKEKRGFLAEVNLLVPRHPINVRARAPEAAPAIDAVAKKAERRLRKLKTRIEKSRKQAPLPEPSPEAIEEVPKLIREEGFLVKTLTEREASLRMRGSNLNFLIYREPGDRRLKVIYRRRDGNLGLIELED